MSTVDIHTGFEPREVPRSVRERAHSEIGSSIERATADRPIAGPDEEDDVTVQIA
jgi:hypothetical protein